MESSDIFFSKLEDFFSISFNTSEFQYKVLSVFVDMKIYRGYDFQC